MLLYTCIYNKTIIVNLAGAFHSLLRIVFDGEVEYAALNATLNETHPFSVRVEIADLCPSLKKPWPLIEFRERF